MWKKIKGSARPGAVVALVVAFLLVGAGIVLGQVMQGQDYDSSGNPKGIRPVRCIDDGSGRYCYMLMGTDAGAPITTTDADTGAGTDKIVEVVSMLPGSGGASMPDVGAGNVGGGTPRVTLAADDPGVALLTTMDADTSTIAGDTTAIETAIQIIDGAYAKVDDDSTSNCEDLSDSSQQYTLPTAGDWYEIRVTGNCAGILCGSNPTATTAKDGQFITVCDGSPFRGPLTGAKCAHIAGTATGRICFVHLNSAL